MLKNVSSLWRASSKVMEAASSAGLGWRVTFQEASQQLNVHCLSLRHSRSIRVAEAPSGSGHRAAIHRFPPSHGVYRPW